MGDVPAPARVLPPTEEASHHWTLSVVIEPNDRNWKVHVNDVTFEYTFDELAQEATHGHPDEERARAALDVFLRKQGTFMDLVVESDPE